MPTIVLLTEKSISQCLLHHWWINSEGTNQIKTEYMAAPLFRCCCQSIAALHFIWIAGSLLCTITNRVQHILQKQIAKIHTINDAFFLYFPDGTEYWTTVSQLNSWNIFGNFPGCSCHNIWKLTLKTSFKSFRWSSNLRTMQRW